LAIHVALLWGKLFIPPNLGIPGTGAEYYEVGEVPAYGVLAETNSPQPTPNLGAKLQVGPQASAPGVAALTLDAGQRTFESRQWRLHGPGGKA
jgi:hypothetical protein